MYSCLFIISNPFIRCSHSFACDNPNETVHFKFDRFKTESMYDYLIIGDPDAFENIDVENFDYLFTIFDDYTLTGKALILDEKQTIGVWATATSLPNFDIYFHRKVFIDIFCRVPLNHSTRFQPLALIYIYSKKA